MSSLFEPVQAGSLKLANRIAMAPLTRPAGNYGFALAFMDQLMRTRVADNTPKSSSH